MRLPPPVSCEGRAERAACLLAAAWNTPCAERRLAWLRAAWHEDALFADECVVLRGVPGLARYIARLRESAGALRFTIDPPEVQGADMCLRWRLRPSHRPAPPLLSGRCHARLGADGRFTMLVSQRDRTPAA